MDVLPVISGKSLVNILQKQGFEVVRTKGSHFRLKHPDGRITTVPVHKNMDLPKGLIRKIIREDIKLSITEFINITKDPSSKGIRKNRV